LSAVARRAKAEAIQLRAQRANEKRGSSCKFRRFFNGALTRALDCFVAEPVIGPRFARTRWLLAMTVVAF
jgi:hypothetical protein